jgi:hypothetical protein
LFLFLENFGFLSLGISGVFVTRYLCGCVHPSYEDAGSIPQNNKVPIFEKNQEKRES